MLTFALGLWDLRGDEAAEQHFLNRVKPLLDSRCVSCHGPDKIKGGLRLDSREATLQAGESGVPAVVPGQPKQSLLLQAVLHARKDLEMPPKDPLTPRDIAVLERWISDGAPWPKLTNEIAFVSSTNLTTERFGDAWHDARNPIARLFGGQRLDLWSLQPISHPSPPKVRNERWIQTPIDRFVLAPREANGESPEPRASRRALARRLCFDLTGLPPTPEQMNRFLADARPDATRRLVEELLDSPAYAEHWARLWLDVVRYSDSNGFDWDEFRPVAWRFRDYVIRSLRADKPFDRFICEQLAGDELFDGPPRTQADQDALVATGYLRLGPQDNSAAAFNEQDRARGELLADLTETTASAFLGLTMSCCRCHDHKYDPFSQADHFRLRAFFEAVKPADDLPLDLASEQDSIRRHNTAIDEQLASLQRARDGILEQIRSRLRSDRTAQLPAMERALLTAPASQRTNELKSKVEAIERKVSPSDKEVRAALAAAGEEKKQHARLETQIAELNKGRRAFMRGLLLTDNEGPVPMTRILFQGDHKSPKDPVMPGFPSVLDPNPAIIAKPVNPHTTGRRLTLAKWIASPTNPFTARVIVNRIWQAYFGRGIVETPNDFGLAGAKPSDASLLDWLATQLVESGWSLKQLHRTIVLSATYQQASSVGGRTARRLTAEQLRDALMSVSGLLRDKNGGPPVWPDLPSEILQANPAFLDDNETKTKGWYPSPPPEQHVRSIYLVQKKTVRVPFLETFDLPENSLSCARRTSSIVPPQALALLNSPLAVEAAEAFAKRVRAETPADPSTQIERAFRLALQRPPSTDEEQTCRKFLERHGLPALCRSLLNLNEFIFVD